MKEIKIQRHLIYFKFFRMNDQFSYTSCQCNQSDYQPIINHNYNHYLLINQSLSFGNQFIITA